MEAILGTLEDALDRFEKGTGDDKEDAKMELKANYSQFEKNLQNLASKGNSQAIKVLERLQKVKSSL
jgi:hypothetical protein